MIFVIESYLLWKKEKKINELNDKIENCYLLYSYLKVSRVPHVLLHAQAVPWKMLHYK